MFILFLASPSALVLAEEPAAEDAAQEEAVPAQEMPPPEPAKPTPDQVQAAIEHETGPHHPPKNLKKVGDHWTPYDPPPAESFPAGSEIHIIEPGDTLWDLAGKHLQTPWLWPQIWDINRYILESHWIYPGDPLLLPGAPTMIAEEPVEPELEEAPAPVETQAEVVPEPEPEPEPYMEEEEAPAPVLPPPPMLAPMLVDTDLYCSNRLVESFEPPALFIEEREEGAKNILGPGDVVFLSQGEADGVKAGALYSIITPEHDVWHPVHKDELVGHSVRTLGRLRVFAVQADSATAEIVDACDAIGVGDYAVPFEEIPVPLSTPVAFDPRQVQISGENAGYIVHVSDDKLSFGSGDIVNLDLGTSDGIETGDVFTVYRDWAGTVEFDTSQMYINKQQTEQPDKRDKDAGEPQYTQIVLGQLVVLAAGENASTAKILVSVKEMAVGDKVEMR